MAVNLHTPKPTNWLAWGGAIIAAIVLIAALGYGFDWFGAGSTETMAPGTEQSAPVSN